MKIWIDITNAPHVMFFKDIIKYFEDQGEDVIVTTRDFGDIHRLMETHDIDFISVGKHGGLGLYKKLKESTNRVNELVDIIAPEKIDVCLAKHSVELPRVSFGLNIPNVYIIDNEYAEAVNKMTLPLCDRIIAPNIIDIRKLMRYGVDPNKIISYDGTSELLHFKNFEYNEKIFEDLNIKLDLNKTILMRPEPSLASYLDVDSEKSVLSPIIDVLKDYANILVLPRFKQQADIFEGIKNVNILEPPIDLSSVIKQCDLVIGAGGTINRESAVLKTPVISCYPGETLAVDQYYINRGLMFKYTNVEDIINNALSFLVVDKENDDYYNQNYDISSNNLFKTIIDCTYRL
nr:DUF354 domain-containing protein [Methanobrevibacter arboriphilus]